MASGKTHLEWAKEFTTHLQRHLGDRLISVVVYGSVATGRERPDSDIDLLIVLEGVKEGHLLRQRHLDPVYQEWDPITRDQEPPFIATNIKSPEEARHFRPLYLDMTDRSILLLDRNDFFKKVLEDVRRTISRLGARREKIGKVEYWDLKPDYKPGEVFEI